MREPQRLRNRPPCWVAAPSSTISYTLSLHDALPILRGDGLLRGALEGRVTGAAIGNDATAVALHHRQRAEQPRRSEEHTSELQSRLHLVCRLLLEKKKQTESFADDPPSQPHNSPLLS